MKILFEDETLIAFYKPALVHSVPGKEMHSFAEQVKSLSCLSPFMKDDPESGFANRLDYETSGIILAGKNKETLEALRSLTQENKIQKNYIFVTEELLQVETDCSLFIGARGRSSRSVKAISKGRKKDRLQEASTFFTPVATIADHLTLVGATIYQGQRHQIRIHANKIMCPLVADPLYGKPSEHFPDITHFLLHNVSVQMEHPIRKKVITIVAFPEDLFASILRQYKVHYSERKSSLPFIEVMKSFFEGYS